MPLNLKERTGKHPYLRAVWHSEIRGQEYLTIPAKSTWDIIVIQSTHRVSVQLSAPHKQPQQMLVGQEGEMSTFTGLRFATGVYVPEAIQLTMPDHNTLNLTNKAGRFGLGQEMLPIPTYDTAELMVTMAKRKGLLLLDKTIGDVLAASQMVPTRALQRRFLRRTDMSKTQVNQLHRAQYVASLLHQGHTLAEAATMAGYADQAHMTRIFKTLYGTTPRNFYKSYIASP